MSIRVEKRCWALELPASPKFVLIALAYFADENARCFPHIATIARHVCASERTVIRALKWLEEHGYIVVQRRGAEGKGSIYTVTAPAIEEADARLSPPPDNLTPPPDRLSPLPCHHVTPPLTLCHPPADAAIVNNVLNNHLTTTEAVVPAKNKRIPVPPCPDGTEQSVYDEWLAHRRVKGCKPLWTARAASLLRNEAKKAGITEQAAMEYAMARNWQTFHAEPYLRDEKGRTPAQEKINEMRRQDDIIFGRGALSDEWRTVDVQARQQPLLE